jgi:hypothetical protein
MVMWSVVRMVCSVSLGIHGDCLSNPKLTNKQQVKGCFQCAVEWRTGCSGMFLNAGTWRKRGLKTEVHNKEILHDQACKHIYILSRRGRLRDRRGNLTIWYHFMCDAYYSMSSWYVLLSPLIVLWWEKKTKKDVLSLPQHAQTMVSVLR